MGDKYLKLHVIVILQALCSTSLITLYNNCRQPYTTNRGRWLHCFGRKMRHRTTLGFGSETYQIYAEITSICKLPSRSWHYNSLIYKQGFKKIILDFKCGWYKLSTLGCSWAEISMVDARIPYVLEVKISKVFHFFNNLCAISKVKYV